MKSLAVLGAGGHAKVVADAALCSGWQNIVLFDDRWPNIDRVGAWKVNGTTQSFLAQASEFDGLIVAIGDNSIRMEKMTHFLNEKIPLATIIHPSAIISPSATIAEGSVVFARAVLNPDCTIGAGTIINTGAIIEHDCTIGHGVHISPGANLAGNVSVGNLSWVGIGSCVRQCIKIGSKVIVGAGSVVVNDLPDNCTAFGVPAKIYKKNSKD
ncbi:acetyltransferase [Fluoribacter gormanii]|uniref:2,3,4,5-tetrahydropyridine-2,6-dicarboxylate N-acetyltransferase n=1 Tax=Fluoribacter gormanii TaxID=464 RepID=A0A377GFN5_9GAMM|nr:acetyltransferase [Fluoribacter gormanii]KTD04600.1 chloramphenicol acetyltransferase [Fluoribacter gormanii]MCW8445040.1 acetyltransferase [Fluoribacter gormanii]MCW8470250.1 acetyltransferase [Fluoribacter gormanii]SIR33055.1 sugar O-acyltransferase, sialic acid O-acetyltransferase NeuD family [Fluoribacter gormanii]STO23394.1 2,3,4,5-tetrahydropyridine-2,6-dicarboxylate N-acetyltransferase [Fluoribacter gormanii]